MQAISIVHVGRIWPIGHRILTPDLAHRFPTFLEADTLFIKIKWHS